MARTSALDEYPELRDFVAVHWHEGFSNQAIADKVAEEWPALEPVGRTIIRWRQDAEVEEKVARMNRERAARVVRRTDAVIMQRLDELAKEMDIDELLKIRKQFLPTVDALGEPGEKRDKAGIVKELFQKASDDPDFAKQLVSAGRRAQNA